MKKKKKIILILVLALIIAGGMTVFFFSSQRKTQFKTVMIQKGEITQTVTATGNVNPVTTILIGTRVSGTIVALYADYNSQVKKSQLIAQIDSTPFENELKQAEAEVLNSKANLFKAEVTLKDTERTFKRKEELFKRDFIARSELDDAEKAYNIAKAQYEIALAQVKKAEAGLQQAKTNLGYTKIVSPVTGVVIAKNVEVGQTVTATLQAPTLFTIAPDLTKMKIDTNVNEADISKIKVGMEASFTVDAYPDRKFKGTVSQIRLSPTVTQNVVTYNVVISVDNSHFLLKPGMTANVTFVVESKKDVLKIPNSALRFRMPNTAPSKQQGVWVIRKEKPVRVNVKTGISDGEWIELIEGDLKEGEKVIVDMAIKKKEGTPTSPRFPVRF
jgi:HlyD family secretion protein